MGLKSRLILGVLLFLFSNWKTDWKGDAMPASNVERLNHFKTEIGIGQLPSPDPQRGIFTVWRDILSVDSLRKGDWEVVGDDLSIRPPAVVIQTWVLKRPEENLSIEIFVSSAGSALARQHLVDLAGNTMTVMVPYKKTVGLGDIAVTHVNPEIDDLIWAYENVCLRIHGVLTSVNVISLAEEIQHLIKSKLVNEISDYLPKLDTIRLSATKIRIREPVSVYLQPNVRDVGHLALKVVKVGETLNLISSDKESIKLEGKSLGSGEIQIILADRRNFLSASKVLTVHVGT